MKTKSPESTLNIGTILSHNKKQLMKLFGVSLYTMNMMLKLVKAELGEPIGTSYSAKQVEFLIETYGSKNKS